MIGEDLSEQVKETVAAIETERVLLGFMPQEQAVNRLGTAENLRNPINHDEIEPEELQEIQQEQREEHIEKWEDAKSNLESPVPFRAEEIQPKELPDEEEVNEHLEEFRDKDSFQESLGDVPDDRWSFKLMPIENLVAFQPNITTTAYEEIPTSEDGIDAVLEYCFPVESTELLMQQQIQSADNSMVGIQFVSRSPNIQLAGMEVGKHEDQRGTFVTFNVKPKANFVQVAHYQDRYLLKNGYHRVFQLMEAGETHVPAVVREVNNYQEAGGQKEGFFSEGLVMGARPPLMNDFKTDVAVDLDKPGTNKVIRVISETTNILR